jgi:Kef-type K+ transport system membrane component KefB
MESTALILTLLGGLVLVGLVANIVGRVAAVPRVTLLLLFGLVIGPSGFDFLPDLGRAWFPVVSTLALVMVGFLLGGNLTVSELRERGRAVLVISLAVVFVTSGAVLLGLRAIGTPWAAALALAAIAAATAPAATTDVVREAGARGPFSRTLLGIVAVDDVWGLILFAFVLAAVPLINGTASAAPALLEGAWEIGGAVVVGCGLGLPMAYLTGRLSPGEPTQAEALGGVFLCGGLCLWLGVSYLLAAVVLGAVVANVARHHSRPFRAIEGIEWPFMTLFFVLAGASLDLTSLRAVGAIGIAYVLLRAFGRVLGGWLGGWLGARVGRCDGVQGHWVGLSLLPQAGVPIGMTLALCQRYPELRDTVLPVVLGATVIFELFGPMLTRVGLTRAGEVVERHASSS